MMHLKPERDESKARSYIAEDMWCLCLESLNFSSPMYQAIIYESSQMLYVSIRGSRFIKGPSAKNLHITLREKRLCC